MALGAGFTAQEGSRDSQPYLGRTARVSTEIDLEGVI